MKQNKGSEGGFSGLVNYGSMTNVAHQAGAEHATAVNTNISSAGSPTQEQWGAVIAGIRAGLTEHRDSIPEYDAVVHELDEAAATDLSDEEGREEARTSLRRIARRCADITAVMTLIDTGLQILKNAIG
jgi:hypothetical protein